MFEKAKKKWKKKLVKLAIPIIVCVLGVAVIATALNSVAAFFANLFNGPKHRTEVEVDNMSLEEIIDASRDPDVITEEALDDMMIDRDTLTNLLEAVNKYNTTSKSATKKIQYKKEYTVTEEVKDKKGKVLKDKKGNTVTKQVSKVEYGWKEYPVTTKEIETCKLDWQVIYCAAVLQSLQMYGENGTLHSENKKEDNTKATKTSELNEEEVEYDASDESVDIIGTKKHIDTPYDDFFAEAAKDSGVPVNLLKALAQAESSMNPNVISCSGCIGIMQLSETTAEAYGCSDRYDPKTNILAGARYFKNCLVHFKGDIKWAACGYNYGIGGADNQNGILPQTEGFTTYIKNIISVYTGKKDLNIATLDIGNLTTFGTMVDDRLVLTDQEIKAIMKDFKPKYNYSFDIVRDKKTEYTFNECEKLPNDGMKSNGGDATTESGLITWYEPRSLLNNIELTHSDRIFQNDGMKVISQSEAINMNRWVTIMTKYWPDYDQEWMIDLINELPGGAAVAEEYENRLVNQSDDISSSGDWEGTASGNYEPLKNVDASINIPKSAGGMSIPLYLQYDSRWGTISPVGSNNMTTSGCGLTSLAMVLSYLENKCIYPTDIYAWCRNRYYVEGSGQSWSLISDGGAQWGYKVSAQSVNADAIVSELSKGHPVIVSTSGNGTSQYFTKGGHYIVLRGLTADGKVLVNDPNDNTSYKNHYAKSYTPEFIVGECTNGGRLKMMWSFSK